MTHTAGLTYTSYEEPDGPVSPAEGVRGADGVLVSLAENLCRIATAPLIYEPEMSWGYSVAADVLGAVVAQTGGASLPEVIRCKVTAPLKMQVVAFVAKDISQLVTPFGEGKARPVQIGEQFSLSLSALRCEKSSARRRLKTNFFRAEMVGTTDDYFRLLEALRKGGAPS